MAKMDRTYLKNQFANNEIPDGNDFKDLIESGINQQDDNIHVNDAKQLGIGTSTPQAKLHVSGDARIDSQTDIHGDVVVHNSGLTVSNTVSAGSVSAPTGSIDDLTAQSVTASGAVQTDSLTVTHHASAETASIQGALNVDDRVRASSADDNEGLLAVKRNSSDGTRASLTVKDQNDTSHLQLDDRGRVALGSNSPTAALHVQWNQSGDALRVDDEVNDSTPMIVTEEGLTGLGTATPQAKLHIEASHGRDALRIAQESGQAWLTAKETGVVVSPPVTAESSMVIHNGLEVATQSPMERAMMIKGSSQIEKHLHVGEDPLADVMFSVRGKTRLVGSTQVDGDSELNGTLTVSGAGTINDDLTVTGRAEIQTGAEIADGLNVVSGDTNISNRLAVGGLPDPDTDLTIHGKSHLKHELTVDEKATLADGLAVTFGLTDLEGGLTVTGNTQLNDALTVGSTGDQADLEVHGQITVAEATHLKSTLDTDEKATFNNGVQITAGMTDLDAGLNVSGTTQINDDVTVGAMSSPADITVYGHATVEQNSYVKGTLETDDKATLNNGLQVANAATDLEAGLNVSGATQLNNDVTVGSDDVSANATFHGSVTVYEPTHLLSTLESDKKATLKDGLQVTTSSADLEAGLNVTGATQLNDELTVGRTDDNADVAIYGELSVSGPTQLQNTLAVDDRATLNNGLQVTASLTNLDDGLVVSGGTTTDTLTASSHTQLNDTLHVTGSTTLDDSFTVAGASTLNNDMTVTGLATVNNGATIANGLAVTSGDTHISERLAIAGAPDSDVELTVHGQSHIKDQLHVDQKTTLNNGLQVSAGVTDLNGALDVAGVSTLQNSATINNGLVVASGHTLLTESLDVDGKTHIKSDFTVGEEPEDNTVTPAGATIHGAATLHSTLDVTDKATLGNGLKVKTGRADLDAGLVVTGNSVMHDNAQVDGALAVGTTVEDGKALSVVGDTSINGDINISKSASIEEGATVHKGLTVTGAVVGDDAFHAQGHIKVDDNAVIDGTTTIGQQLVINNLDNNGSALEGLALEVKGPSQLSGNVITEGSVTVTEDVTVNKTLAIENLEADALAIAATGNVKITGKVDITGSEELDGILKVKNTESSEIALDVDGNASINGNTAVDGALTISNSAEDEVALAVTGDTDVTGSLVVNNTGDDETALSVGGDSHLQGHVKTDDKVTVSIPDDAADRTALVVEGQSTLKEKLVAEQGADITGHLGVSGVVQVTGPVQVSGATNLDSHAAVGDYLVVGGTECDSEAKMTIHGNSHIHGDTYLEGDLRVTADLTVNDTAHIKGHGTFDEGLEVRVPTTSDDLLALDMSGDGLIDGDLEIRKIAKVGGYLDVNGGAEVEDNLQAGSLNVAGSTGLNGELSVAGATSLSGVEVDQDANFNKDVTVNNGGILTVTGNSVIEGNESVEGALNIAGDAVEGKKLTVAGDSQLAGVLSVGGDALADKTLTVTGDSHLEGNLKVNGETSVSGWFQALDDVTVRGVLRVPEDNIIASKDLEVKENAEVGGRLLASDISIHDSLSTGGAVDIGNKLSVTNTSTEPEALALEVTGASYLKDDVRLDGDLTLNGILKTDQGMVIDPDNNTGPALDVRGDMIITGRQTISDDATVAGFTTLNDGLSVARDASFAGNVVVRDNLEVQGDSRLIGDITAEKTVRITNANDRDTALSVAGGSEFNGDITLNGTLKTSEGLEIDPSNNNGPALKVNGDLEVTETLCALGQAEFRGSAQFNSVISVDENASFTRDAVVGRNLEVTGEAGIFGDITAHNAVRVKGPSQFDDDITLNGTLRTSQGMEIEPISSTGPALKVKGQLQVTDNLDAMGQAAIRGFANFESGIAVRDNSSFESDLTVQDNFEVHDTSRLFGDVIANKSLSVNNADNAPFALDVDGPSRFESDVTLNGNLHTSQGLTVAGANTLDQVMSVAGNTWMDGELEVNDAVRLHRNLDVDGSVTVNSSATVNGNLSIDDSATVNNDLTVGDNLSVNDNINVGRDINVSGHASIAGQGSYGKGLTVNPDNLTGWALVANGKVEINGAAEVGGRATFAQGLDIASNGLSTDSLEVRSAGRFQQDVQIQGGLAFLNNVQVDAIDDDIDLGSGNSSHRVLPTQKAVKDYVDLHSSPFGFGGRTFTVRDQDTFEKVFGNGSEVTIAPYTTILLMPPAENPQPNPLVVGNDPGISHPNEWPAVSSYVLRNSVRLSSGVSIIGFNARTTIVVKEHANHRFIIQGSNASDKVYGITCEGWTFNGGARTAMTDGGAFYLNNAENCVLNCSLIGHYASGRGGAIFGMNASRIRAEHIRACRAIGSGNSYGGGVYGLHDSVIRVDGCVSDHGGGASNCSESKIIAMNCEATYGGGVFQCSMCRVHARDCAASQRGGGACFCSDMVCEGYWTGNTGLSGYKHIYANNNQTGSDREEHFWRGDYVGQRLTFSHSEWRSNNL